MNRSILNTFDSNIQDTSLYLNAGSFNYSGSLEYTQNKKIIKIIAYTQSSVSEVLTVYHHYDPCGNIFVGSDTYTYYPNNSQFNIYLVEVRSNFFYINIVSADVNINPAPLRLYNCYLVSDDLSLKLYDTSGTQISSTNNSLNVYNTRNLSQNTDTLNAHIFDSSGHSLNSINGSLNVNSTMVDNIYTLLNTRGTATLYNNSNNQYSSHLDLTNINIKSITMYGNSSGSTTLTVQCSNDGSTWYSSQYSVVISSGGGGDFGFCLSGFCSRFLRLENLNFNSCAITAYIDFC
jgi:hypothetical protein